VRLEDTDYETIYVRLDRDCLVEPVQDKFRLTKKGREELRILAEMPVATDIGTRRKFLDARKINWFAEGL
jgi:DNA-binding PadR family transcriptional regulator